MSLKHTHLGGLCLLILLLWGTLQAPMQVNSATNTSNKSPLPETELSTSEDSSFFPLGLYGVLNTTEILKSWNNYFNTLAIGFSELPDFKLPIEDMLFTCDVLGLRVLFDTSYFLRNRVLTDLMDIVLSVVDHSSIYAWYIVDEPGHLGPGINWTHIDENLIREAVDIIHRIDSRPTFVQFSLVPINASNWETFDEVPDIVDFISVDPYPNMPYTNHSIVSDWVDTINQYNADRAKVWAVLTAQDFSQAFGDHGFDIPTEPEYMIDALLALQRGVDGLFWFAYGTITDKAFGASQVPASWDALGRVVQRISQVTPILVDRENEMQPFFVTDKLEVAYAKRGTQTLVLLTNHDYSWNGTETVWNLKPIPLKIKASNVSSISQIEPFGQVPLKFRTEGEFISFNVTVDGGLILLIESEGGDLIVLSELSSWMVLFATHLVLIITLRSFRRRKSTIRYS